MRRLLTWLMLLALPALALAQQRPMLLIADANCATEACAQEWQWCEQGSPGTLYRCDVGTGLYVVFGAGGVDLGDSPTWTGLHAWSNSGGATPIILTSTTGAGPSPRLELQTDNPTERFYFQASTIGNLLVIGNDGLIGYEYQANASAGSKDLILSSGGFQSDGDITTTAGNIGTPAGATIGGRVIDDFVSNPNSVTNNALCRFDGTSGTLIEGPTGDDLTLTDAGILIWRIPGNTHAFALFADSSSLQSPFGEFRAGDGDGFFIQASADGDFWITNNTAPFESFQFLNKTGGQQTEDAHLWNVTGGMVIGGDCGDCDGVSSPYVFCASTDTCEAWRGDTCFILDGPTQTSDATTAMCKDITAHEVYWTIEDVETIRFNSAGMTFPTGGYLLDGVDVGAHAHSGGTGGTVVGFSDISGTTDAIRTVELSDGADTPATGQCLLVAADVNDIEYATCPGGGADSFKTWSATGGVDAVADSSTDTMTVNDSSTIGFTTANDPETITAIVIDDSITTGKLSDGGDTPSTGQCLLVGADVNDVEYDTCPGGGANSFETWNTDLGTNPVADSSTDAAQLTSAIAFTITGANDPESVTFDHDYGNEMTTLNIDMELDECLFRTDANGGGFVCEGNVKDANETEYLFQDGNEADVSHEIVTLAQTQTLTDKTLTTPTIGDLSNAGHDHSDAANGGALQATVVHDDEASTFASAGTQVFNDPVELKPNGTDGVAIGAAGLLQVAGTGEIQASQYAGPGSTSTDIDLGTIEVVGTLDLSDHVNLGNGRSTTVSGDAVDADIELYEHTKCIIIEDPATADNFLFWHVERAATLTGIDCISEDATSTTIQLQECDGGGGGCGASETGIACDTNGATESGGFTDPDIDGGDWMRANVTSVSGTPGHVTFCVTFTVND
jgi:hypothetical protein